MCVVSSTYSQPPHNSCDLHMWDDWDLACSITDHKAERLPHSDPTIWNVTHTIHTALLSFRGYKNYLCEPNQIIKKATHLRLSILEVSYTCTSCSELGGGEMAAEIVECRMAAEIVSAWDYITEFHAFTQRISPQEETGTVWPSGLNRDFKKFLFHIWEHSHTCDHF